MKFSNWLSCSGVMAPITWLVFLSLSIFSSCVSDDDGGSSNNSPIIEALTASPDTVNSGAASLVVCVAGDLDGDILDYDWSTSGGVVSGAGDSVNWISPETVGQYLITCAVEDNRGGSDQASVGIAVIDQTLTGNLNIVSLPPGANIYLDGSSLNVVTPYSLELEVGVYSLMLTLAGYNTWGPQDVSVESGETTNINAPLDLINNPPVIDQGSVYPDNGTDLDEFTYTIEYYDEDGDPPSEIRVHIDYDDGNPMDFVSGVDLWNGTYEYVTTLAPGNHNYYFIAHDGNGGMDRFPSSEAIEGPTVESSLPYFEYDSYVLTDNENVCGNASSNGEPNDLLNPDEFVCLSICIRNIGNGVATNATGSISVEPADEECYNENNETGSWSDILPGDVGCSGYDFDFELRFNCMPPDEELDFILLLNYRDQNGIDQPPQELTFEVPAYWP